MRNLGGAIGIAACGTILNDRTNLHFLGLAEHLTATNAAMLSHVQTISARGTSVFGDAGHGQVAAIRELRSITYREAQIMPTRTRL